MLSHRMINITSLRTLRTNREWLKARFENSRFHPRRFTRVIRTEPGFTFRLNILDRPQPL